jgi:excisionase family DNA binding protein
MDERLLKPAEVAEILQVSKAMAYALMQRGEIPTVRIGKVVRVRRMDLQKYIDLKVAQEIPDSYSIIRQG